jgi:Disulphide bond corrector protein DsbC
MKKIYLFLSVLFLSIASFAQEAPPVDWNFSAVKVSEGKYEVKLVATMKGSWHIYSSTTPEGGPIPTTVTFTKNPLTTLNGKIKEVGKMEKHFEKVFDLDTRYYNSKVEFVQLVNLKGKAKTNLAGTVEYMACTDQQCLPPKEIPFSIALK